MPYSVYTTDEGPPQNSPTYSFDDGQILLFSDKTICMGFVRKVFWILFLQVFFTFGLVALLTFVEPLNSWLQDSGNAVLYASIGLLLLDGICIGLILAKPKVVKKTPLNYIVLVLITTCTSLPLAALTVYIETKLVVFYVMGMTLAMVFSTSLFTLQSSRELSYVSGFLVTVLGTGVAGAIMYFVAYPGTRDPSAHWYLIAAWILVLLFGFFWIAIIKGLTKKGECSPEDFILAAMLLYISVVLIFLVVLLIVAAASSGNSSNIRCYGGGWLWFWPWFGGGSRETQEDMESRQVAH